MGIMDVQWLASPEGQSAIERLVGADPLTARRLLPDLSAEQVTAALTQAKHRPPGFPLPLVTADGVQMATPVAVAMRRAQRLAAQGVRHIIDAGCGIGVDAWAFSQAGLTVTAFESDPHTAQIASANLSAGDVEVISADVTNVELPPGTLYVDPARRRASRSSTGQALRVNNPEQWSPPWSWVLEQSRSRPVVARIRPGMRDLPAGVEWQCSSIGRKLVDATVWFPPLRQVDARACVFADGDWHELTGPAATPITGEVGGFIIDPDPAIVRCGLVADLAQELGGHLIDEHLAFVTCDSPPPRWAGRGMQVEREVPAKRIAAVAAALGMTRVTVWARGFSKPPSVSLPEGPEGIVVMARVGSRRAMRCWIGRRSSRESPN